ncbi:hypothetical protein CMK13_04405 [Candidatus Poribacteria bacterium]|mgnify:FL=1|jgi:hypothetical protein|nr:hypothetical protein [Candidatus Poribacteria bacterium]OUT64586.1 MAG: hypothetical protein CBB75_04110 [bacterium TMED15]
MKKSIHFLKAQLIWLLVLFVGVAQSKTKNIYFLGGNASNVEAPTISKEFKKVENYNFTYSITDDTKLPKLTKAKFDFVWLGQGEICENGYKFTPEGSKAVVKFVKEGGICINVEQDHDDNIGCRPMDWFPVKMDGAERPGTQTFTPTDKEEVGTLFTKPNKIKSIRANDKWHNADKSVIPLATNDAGDYMIAALLKHGKGAYIITAMQNENQGQVDLNRDFIENILFYAANLQDILLSVEARDKLSIAWGKLKTNR